MVVASAHVAAPDLKPKDLVGIPWRVAFALQADGWWLRSDIIWAKPNCMPENITDRPTKSHEYVFLLAKSEQYFFDADAVREPHTSGENTRGWGRERERVKHGDNPRFRYRPPSRPPGYIGHERGRNFRTVWTITTEPYPDAHFATFPTKLAERCILAGCPAGGTVLDPFGGSGTVGRVAEDLGRQSILIELNPDYVRMAERRCAQTGLFAMRVAGEVTV